MKTALEWSPVVGASYISRCGNLNEATWDVLDASRRRYDDACSNGVKMSRSL